MKTFHAFLESQLGESWFNIFGSSAKPATVPEPALEPEPEPRPGPKIYDLDILDRIAEVEGVLSKLAAQRWRQQQERNRSDPNNVYAHIEAYKALKAKGLHNKLTTKEAMDDGFVPGLYGSSAIIYGHGGSNRYPRIARWYGCIFLLAHEHTRGAGESKRTRVPAFLKREPESSTCMWSVVMLFRLVLDSMLDHTQTSE
jgi:hypothetical protein